MRSSNISHNMIQMLLWWLLIEKLCNLVLPNLWFWLKLIIILEFLFEFCSFLQKNPGIEESDKLGWEDN